MLVSVYYITEGSISGTITESIQIGLLLHEQQQTPVSYHSLLSCNFVAKKVLNIQPIAGFAALV